MRSSRHSKVNMRLRILKLFIIMIIIIILIALNNINEILSLVTDSDTRTNLFTITGTYMVQFDANGGTGTMLDQIVFRNTQTGLRPNEFTREGYRFAGWNTEADGSGDSYTNGQSVNDLTTEDSTITLYAQWSEMDGIAIVNGVAYPTLQAAINAVPTNGVKTTVTLLGNVTENLSVAVGKNIEFDFKNFTVTNKNTTPVLSNNGTVEIKNGTIRMTSESEGGINNKSNAVLKITGGTIENVTTGGKQAIYNSGGTVEISGDAYISSLSGGSSVVNERATIENVSGTLKITGGTIVSANSDGVKNSDKMIIGTNDGNVDITSPVIQGKKNGVVAAVKFNFYDGIIKGNNSAISDETKVANIEVGYNVAGGIETIDNIPYKTAYLATKAKVIFDATGGTASEDIRYIGYGELLGTLPTATHQYKIFAGWWTLAEGGREIDATEQIDESTTFYAHWNTYNITLTLDVNANDATIDETEIEVVAGDSVGTLPEPERIGYTFSGWYTSAEGGQLIDENSIFGENQVLYAHWSSKYAARIGTKMYDTLQEAINAVPKDNTETTIVVMKDIVEAVGISAGQNIVLDLQNFTLSNDGTKKFGSKDMTIENKGTLKIASGTVTSIATSATINNEAGARLIITGGNITQPGTKNKQAIYNDGGTVEISGNPYIYAKNDGTYNGYDRGAIQNLNSGSLIINGGTIVSETGYGIVNQSGCTFDMGTEDGSFRTSAPVIQAAKYGLRNAGTFSFYDGIIKGKTGVINGSINATETGATRVDTQEVIDGTTYNVLYYDMD